MTKRKAHKMHSTAKQKEAGKRNWTVFQIRGVIELMGCHDILKYPDAIQKQAGKIKSDLKDLLDMVKEENANHKHS